MSDKVRKNIYISEAVWKRLVQKVGKRGASPAIESAVKTIYPGDVLDICPYCRGTALDLTGGTGGSCPHCLNGVGVVK